MNEFSLIATSWLLRTLFAGGLLLAAAWLLMRTFGNPALREKLAGWAIRGAVLTAILGIFPAWLTIPISLTKTDGPAAIVTEAKSECPAIAAVEFEPPLDTVPVEDVIAVEAPAIDTVVALTPTPAVETCAVAETKPLIETLRTWVLITYGSIVVFGLLQLLAAVIGLVRLRRSAKPVPQRILRLLPEDAPTVLMSNRVSTPVCFGFRTPTVLLPEALLGTASDSELRWVLAHELDHLRRGDARTGIWVGLARAVYFALPWFWALRRDLRLAQEYLADAVAAAGRNADYAAFLVHLSGPSNA